MFEKWLIERIGLLLPLALFLFPLRLSVELLIFFWCLTSILFEIFICFVSIIWLSFVLCCFYSFLSFLFHFLHVHSCWLFVLILLLLITIILTWPAIITVVIWFSKLRTPIVGHFLGFGLSVFPFTLERSCLFFFYFFFFWISLSFSKSIIPFPLIIICENLICIGNLLEFTQHMLVTMASVWMVVLGKSEISIFYFLFRCFFMCF